MLTPAPTILTLPLPVLDVILRHLLTTPTPIILSPSAPPPTYRTRLYPAILRTCRQMYNDGLPILYGENIITASSPLTSFNFDEDLAALSGKHRQLIRWISLEIGWADDLWAKFPLVARYVGEIRGLKGLEIVILEQNQKSEGGRRAITGHVGREIKREGQLSEMMLKAEKKMFRDLVEVLQSLREFYLVGFRDKDFAMRLESWVGAGRRKT